MRLLVARCTVRYEGRLAAVLPEATRLVMVKADGCVCVHSDGGAYKPLNWMTAPNTIRYEADRWVVSNPKGETLTIELHEVMSDIDHDLGIDPGLQKEGVEAHLQELLSERTDALAPGMTLIRREYPTDIGPVDLLCKDADGVTVAVEIKRRGEIDGVEQLTRYLEYLNREPHLAPVRGMFVAQQIKPQAKVLAGDRRIVCVEVDYDELRDRPSNVLRPVLMSTPSGPVTLMVTDVFASQYATQLDALRNVGRGLELVVVDASTPRGTEAEVAFFSPDEFPGNTARLLPRARDAASIKWFHTMTAGVDNPVFLSFPARGVRLTTSSGATAIPIAQSVVLDLLALTRRMRETLGHQAAHRWERLMGADVAGGTAVVVGMGPIGYEVARLLSALRMSVIGLRRSVAGDEPCETWTFDRWPEAVRRADVVVMAVPLTDDTRHLLDAPSLAALRPGAIVINIGRGELIDEEALIESLRSGHLGGAGLDVFTVEPLPADSPLWDLPNVIITPHSSGLTPSTRVAMCEIFLDNLGRYLRDEPLRNEVLPS